ncbi:uncharacterized protein V1516DRAFT_711499 [Lipomyces oligophaga]|uniref:uncharacterized protein n=1 Tax=Lipomyces oligophaga TaxID=45792 RepID=UPI0034CEBE29
MFALIAAPVTGIAILMMFNRYLGKSTTPRPLVHELPTRGLLSVCIHPQFRNSNKVYLVNYINGTLLFKFIRRYPALNSDRDAADEEEDSYLVYSLTHPTTNFQICSIKISKLSSQILFNAATTTDNLKDLGLIDIRTIITKDDVYKMFILSNGSTYQWSFKTKQLEQVIDRSTMNEPEVRNQVAVVRRMGSNTWEFKFDEEQLPAEVVLSTGLVSILEQWTSTFGF